MSTTPKQREELALATWLVAALGYRDVAIEPGDRPDVIAQLGGLRIGIEVTQFHGDESADSKGSPARATEEHLARQSPGRSYFMWGTANPNAALVARVTDKIATAAAYDATRYGQLWLLIATGLPKLGAVGATFTLPVFVDIEELNVSTHEPLRGSPFSAVYVHMHLPAALFCWSRESKWHALNVQSG